MKTLILILALALQGGQGGNPPGAALPQGQHGKPPPGVALQGAGNGGIPPRTIKPNDLATGTLPALTGEYSLTGGISRWARVAVADDGTRAWVFTRANQCYARLQNPDGTWKTGDIWLTAGALKKTDECEVEVSGNTFFFTGSERYAGWTISMNCWGALLQSDGSGFIYISRLAPSITTTTWLPRAEANPDGSGFRVTYTEEWSEEAGLSDIFFDGSVRELPNANAWSGASQSYSIITFGRGRDIACWMAAEYGRAYRGRLGSLKPQVFTGPLSWECRMAYKPGEIATVWHRAGRIEGRRLESDLKPLYPIDFIGWGRDAEIGLDGDDVILVWEGSDNRVQAVRWDDEGVGPIVRLSGDLGPKPGGEEGRRTADVWVLPSGFIFSWQETIPGSSSNKQQVRILEAPLGLLP